MHTVFRQVGVGFAVVVVLGTIAAVGVGGAGPATAVTNDTNLTHHEDPAAVDGEGNVERVRGWLSDRLTERLQEQSIRLSEGEYEAAAGLVDDEFEQRLEQYVDVAGDTGGGEQQSESAQAIERAGRSQQRLGEAASAFESAYEDYQAARERGNADAAHEHARRLGRVADRIDGRGNNATGALRTIQNQTGTTTVDARERIETLQEDVARRQSQVRQATFVETSIRANANREVASFARPATISGRIQTARGEPLANKQIDLRIGERRYSPETDGDGAFSIVYRPVGVAATATAVDVSYLPSDETPYRSSSTTVPVSIKQVRPNVTTTVHPRSVGYGEKIDVSTGVTVGDRTVPGVPVRTSISGTDLGSAVTAPTGVTNASWSVPIDAPVGDGIVEVRVSGGDRAVAAANATEPVTVTRTPTSLSVDASADEQVVSVDGRLAVDAAGRDESIPAGLPVVVTVGEHRETAQTEAGGQFRVSVPRATLDGPGESVTVTVGFDGNGTNLGPASTEKPVALPTTGTENTLPVSETVLAVGGGVVIVVLAGVLVLIRRRRNRSTVTESDVTFGSGAVAADAVPQTDGAPVAPDTAEYTDVRWLAGARAALADGAVDPAVASAYAAAHSHVTDELGLEGVSTPRELLDVAKAHIEDERYEALRTVTTLYERVIFAGHPTDGAGERASEAAATVLGVETDDRPGTEPAPVERGDR